MERSILLTQALGASRGALKANTFNEGIAQVLLEGTMAERTAPVTVNFKPQQLEELRELAEAEHRSLSQQVQYLVARGLESAYETEAAE
jgi:hypothetical protein